jgi:GNAT superfamily N-acetyltransferase
MPGPGLRLRRLGRADRAAVERHLLDLDTTDRASRFRTPLGDAAVRAYARALDLGRTMLVGAQGPDGALLGLAEAHPGGTAAVEVAVSVDAAHRRQGLARALLARALELAAGRGAVVAELAFTPGHAAIARLARSLGGEADCCRGEARIALPHPLDAVAPRRRATAASRAARVG